MWDCKLGCSCPVCAFITSETFFASDQFWRRRYWWIFNVHSLTNFEFKLQVCDVSFHFILYLHPVIIFNKGKCVYRHLISIPKHQYYFLTNIIWLFLFTVIQNGTQSRVLWLWCLWSERSSCKYANLSLTFRDDTVPGWNDVWDPFWSNQCAAASSYFHGDTEKYCQVSLSSKRASHHQRLAAWWDWLFGMFPWQQYNKYIGFFSFFFFFFFSLALW